MTEEPDKQAPESIPEVEPKEEDLTLENIGSIDAMIYLGKVASTQLLAFGTCTLIADEKGNIRTLNPYSVFVDAKAAHAADEIEPVFVRPILTNRRPQYVARKEDGSLWEVEYPTVAE